MATQVQEREEELEPEGLETTEAETPPEAGDDLPDVNVDERDGKTEVELHHESKKERRQREARERQQRAIDDAVRPLREENQRVGRQLGELMELLRTQRTAPAPGPEAQRPKTSDDLDEELLDIKQQQAHIIERVKTVKTEGEARDLERRYHRLEQQAIDLRAGKIVQDQLSKFQPPRQMPYQEQMIRAEFPDVFANADAQEYAWALLTQAKAMAKARGEQWDALKASREALNKAAIDFNLRKAPMPAPSPAQAARFGNRGAGVGPSKGTAPTKRTLTPTERHMALLSDDREDISDAQKIANWTRKMEAQGYWSDK